MIERKYSVHEIDALRCAVENRYLWGSFSPPAGGAVSCSYKEDEKAKVVEEEVRTYMLAGITADELYASERERHNQPGRFTEPQEQYVKYD